MKPLALQIDPSGGGEGWQTLDPIENQDMDRCFKRAFETNTERVVGFILTLLDGKTVAYKGHLVRARL